MLRRTIPNTFRFSPISAATAASASSAAGGGKTLSGNGVIAIRREDKNVWERRVPLVPHHVKELLKYNLVQKVIVQPSTTRCFNDDEYARAGAEIDEDLSAAGTILAVKEVPGQLLLPNRSYMFFSHTIKAQAYNMPLLDTIVSSNVRLFDYERILGPDGRMVKFGPQAGYAGVIDALNALGLALMTRGFATPFLNVSLSREYRSLEVARQSIRIAGDKIRAEGLPKGAAPIVFGVTGSGSVSMAAQEILHLLPCKYVEVEDLPRIHSMKNIDHQYVYVCVIKAKDMVVPKDFSSEFDRLDYYRNPDKYKPVFHERVAPYLSVLITGHYWEPRFPRLLSTQQARDLVDEDRFPWLVLADITCDIGGSIEFFVKSTSIQNPFYAYDLQKNTSMDIQDYQGNGIVILGVDHLPAEFPRESSASFGKNLKDLVPIVANSPSGIPLEEQLSALGKPLFNSMVTCDGALTPNYKYIMDLRAKNKEKMLESQKKKVLVFGAGMMSAPCIFTLLEDKRNLLTVVDVSQQNLTSMHNTLRKSENETDLARVRFVRAGVASIDSYVETLIKESDAVVSLLPATMHPAVADVSLRHKVPLVTASYVSPGMEQLRDRAEKSGTLVVNEMGLDPGIDLMTSAALLNQIKEKGGNVRTYISLCGALPAPENSNCPLGYKFSWSPLGVLTAASRPARFKINDKWYDLEGDFLYWFPQPIEQFKGLDLYWLPNGDVTKYAKTFDIDDAATLMRGTIRYPGFACCIRAFKVLNMLDDKTQMSKLLEKATVQAKGTGDPKLRAVASGVFTSGENVSWPELIRLCAFSESALKFAGESGAQAVLGDDIKPSASNIFEWLPKILTSRLTNHWKKIESNEAYKALCESMLMQVQSSSHHAGKKKSAEVSLETRVAEEVAEIMTAFSQLRLLNTEAQCTKTPAATPVHSLCRTLVHNLAYKNHERDYVIMYHRVVAEFPKENKLRSYDMTLTMRGKSATHSATAETVGVPVGLTAQHVLNNNGLGEHKGLVSPTVRSVYEPVLAGLARHGIEMQESITETPLNQSKI